MFVSYPGDLPARPASASSPPRILAERFELTRQIGAGVSGTVYEAFDRKHLAHVALKLLHGRTGDPLIRFKREFRALQAVRHPNIVSFGELFADGDEWFFTMELLSGVDFRSFVRHTGRLDERRLRGSIQQLADALATLHAAGIVHRDVKPANVAMSNDGRATLLDFGVVKDPGSPSHSAPELVSFVGTPAYMAPEQISGDCGAPADCYAVGVMLYEALTGRLPFAGKVAEVLQAKQVRVPVSPIAIDGAVPQDLSDLALELLAIDPDLRPTASDLARRISRTAPVTSSIPPSDRGPSFFGRRAELDAIEEAAREAQEGRTSAALIVGESGIGKSALARQFVSALRAGNPNALVLTSRCRETEWIPYKAFDGLIEGLSRFMRTLGDADAAVLLPLRASLVAQAFPALARVGSIAQAPPTRASDLDLVRQRRLLFASVRELLARVAQRYTLVLYIDDLQWADADSLALLSDVMRAPDAPPLLLLATARADGIAEEALPRCLREARRIHLGPLSPADAAELARKLASRADATLAIDAGAIARETDGHPLFIHELVCHAVAGAVDGSALRLDDALAKRIAALDASARELLECVALAARPMTRAVLARATSLHGNDTYRLVNLLGASNLVKMGGVHAERIEPFHDRVRHAVLRDLEGPRVMKRHRRIAAALEFGDERDNEALAYHWREAKKPDRAAPYAEAGAAEAERALAFDQAARLYRTAIDLGVGNAEHRVALLSKLGDALANAGRSVLAAGAYREAAALAPPATKVTHLQKAADQLMRGGNVEEGLALAHDVLAQLGLGAPKSRWRALFSFLFWRCLFAMRGLSFRERAAADVPSRELAKIDTTWSITSVLSTIDPIRGAYFQMRHLRLALRAGEPYRVVRAAALQIGYGAGPGAEAGRRSQRLAERCAALSERIGNPHGIAITQMAAGIASYLQGDFVKAIALIDDAERRLRACPGTWGEIARARRFALSALASLGRMKELRARVYAHLRDAREHGDLHATTNLRIGHPNMVWLMEDDVEGARHELASAMKEWPFVGFQLEHHYELFAATNIDLYAGDPLAARARQLEAWPHLRRSFLLSIPAARIVATSSRARAAIACAEIATDERDVLLGEATRMTKQIAREPLPFAAPTAELLYAGIASARGVVSEAYAHAANAERGFAALDMYLHAGVARRCRGLLVGGDVGATIVTEADEWMANEEVAKPAKMAAMIAPGFTKR